MIESIVEVFDVTSRDFRVLSCDQKPLDNGMVAVRYASRPDEAGYEEFTD